MTIFQIPNNVKSMHDIILWSESLFKQSELYFGHGTDNALDEAAYLISYCADKAINFSDDDLSYCLSKTQRERVEDVLALRINNKLPAAYITKKAYFFGLEFEVNESVLVPRSPIAELIAEQFFPWFDLESHLKNTQSLKILDMCTGSGCIGIACAVAFENAIVDLVDVSESALEIANRNIVKHSLSQRVTAIQSDMFCDLKEKKYDIIVSNPPYVTQDEIDCLPDEYHKEPSLGLYANQAGLQFAIAILKNAKKYLSKNGIVVVEVGNSTEALQQYYPDIAFTWLEFEMGGEGVFMLDAAQINQYHSQF